MGRREGGGEGRRRRGEEEGKGGGGEGEVGGKEREGRRREGSHIKICLGIFIKKKKRRNEFPEVSYMYKR